MRAHVPSEKRFFFGVGGCDLFFFGWLFWLLLLPRWSVVGLLLVVWWLLLVSLFGVHMLDRVPPFRVLLPPSGELHTFSPSPLPQSEHDRTQTKPPDKIHVIN